MGFGPRKTVACIDVSNIIYGAFHSSWKIFCDEFNIDTDAIDETFDAMDDIDMKMMFRDRFMEVVVNNVQPNVSFFNWSNIILISDCQRDRIWRREIYPEYKASRKEKKKYSKYQGKWSGIFSFIMDELIPELYAEYGTRHIAIDRAECDDIVGILVLNDLIEADDILLVTSDKDYHQLISEKVRVVSPYTGVVYNIENTNPKYELKMKILGGDPSDDIKQAFPRHGSSSKGLVKLCEDKEYFNDMVEKYPDAKQKIVLNTRLIDMRYIPKVIKERVIKRWEEINNG